MRHSLVALAVLASGCSARWSDETLSEMCRRRGFEQCQEDNRRFTTATDDEALKYVAKRAVERISAAAGSDVQFVPFGHPDAGSAIPFRWEEDLEGRGDDACGHTVTMFAVSDIDAREHGMVQEVLLDPTPDVGCNSMVATAMHELIHALNPRSKHTSRGLFKAECDGTEHVDEDSLDELCSGFDCGLFVPETPR